MNLNELSQKLEDHLTDQDIQEAQELLDNTYQEIVDMRGELIESQAELAALRTQAVADAAEIAELEASLIEREPSIAEIVEAFAANPPDFDDLIKSVANAQTLAEAQAEIERLRAELEAKNNHTMNWRREIINPSMAHMGAALVALRNGDAAAARGYLKAWLDAGGVCYELYTSHEVFFKQFFTDLQCDHKDSTACAAAIAEFSRRMTEDQKQDDEN